MKLENKQIVGIKDTKCWFYVEQWQSSWQEPKNRSASLQDRGDDF